jgi:hypothetical protein
MFEVVLDHTIILFQIWEIKSFYYLTNMSSRNTWKELIEGWWYWDRIVEIPKWVE